MKNSIGEVLRKAREKAKMSQTELANKMGYISPQFVSNWERGLCGVPASKAAMFCKITGMKITAMKALLLEEASRKLDKRFSLKLSAKKKKYIEEDTSDFGL